jgi:CRP/FNR family transcriptional regulator
MREISKVVFQRVFAADTEIIIEGEPCTAVYFILEGEVCVYRISSDGKEQILARLMRGETFNTVPPIHYSGLNQASARAITNVVLAVILKEDYVRFLQSLPDFSYAVLVDFAERLAHLTNLVENLSLHSVRGRLARFLLEQANQDQIFRRWTQDEIAEHIGTVRDVVGRTLRVFVDEGLIRRERNKILLMDRERLENEAKT